MPKDTISTKLVTFSGEPKASKTSKWEPADNHPDPPLDTRPADTPTTCVTPRTADPVLDWTQSCVISLTTRRPCKGSNLIDCLQCNKCGHQYVTECKLMEGGGGNFAKDTLPQGPFSTGWVPLDHLAQRIVLFQGPVPHTEPCLPRPF